MGELLESRRATTGLRIEELRKRLQKAEELCGESACVYATGSFARGEASAHSDLDLFIASHVVLDQRGDEKPGLSGLNEILVKADLIKATRDEHIADFSGDGEYLKHYWVRQLVKELGTREDDFNNTFTARLLLLLESQPLVGESAYGGIMKSVIAAYWRDYESHSSDFVPGFLANDIIRMWRTFCVNYEARSRNVPDRERAKRALKNYKLKHSRLLTCYSALLYLLGAYSRNETVSPDDVEKMIRLTPTRRVEWLLADNDFNEAHGQMRDLLVAYEGFLESTDFSEEEMIERFLDKNLKKALFESGQKFGDLVFDILGIVGKGSRLHRLLVV